MSFFHPSHPPAPLLSVSLSKTDSRIMKLEHNCQLSDSWRAQCEGKMKKNYTICRLCKIGTSHTILRKDWLHPPVVVLIFPPQKSYLTEISPPLSLSDVCQSLTWQETLPPSPPASQRDTFIRLDKWFYSTGRNKWTILPSMNTTNMSCKFHNSNSSHLIY